MLFIMRGTSCSGKSTFVKNRFQNSNSVISSDNFREMYLGSREAQQYNDMIFDKMKEVIEYRLINKVTWTVLDATNLRIKDASPFINLCKQYHTKFTVISIVPPTVDELIERNKNRSALESFDVPENILRKHHKHHDRYYNCKPAFLEEAYKNRYCSFIEIDQNEEVVCEIV